jgi:DMSO reductase anchor subunit
VQPALSVILLTTLIGAGQGLFLALVAAHSGAAFGLLPAAGGPELYTAGVSLVLALMGGGLVASFFHLGRPERAWRTATKWRTSWLSREVIVLPAFTGVAFLYGAAHWLGWAPAAGAGHAGAAVDAALLLGWVGAILALALFVCTAMIYACLRFLAEWHSPLTVINYVLLGTASGFTLGSALAASAEPALLPFFL